MATAKLQFAILGAGAIGSIMGAHLARSGHAVVMLARGQRARDIERGGLRIKGLAEFSQPVPVLTDASRLEGADVLIVATKSYATEAALQSLRDAKFASAFSIQNGLQKNEQLAAVWGRECVLGALADISGELLPTGEVLFTRNEQLCIGELAASGRARAQSIARLMNATGVRTIHAPNIEDLEWSKFAAWAAMMILSVTARAETWKYLSDFDLALVAARIVREIGALSAALKISFSDRSPLPVATIVRGSEDEAAAAIQAVGHRLKLSAPQHRVSTLQDLEAGRPLEIEETLGYALRSAARLNVSVPLLRSCHALVTGIDRIRRAN